jgi:hypothetical protein
MKIIITEKQNYVLRRLHQFIDDVEKLIDKYESDESRSTEGKPWWCSLGSPNFFFSTFKDTVVHEFMNQHWEFFDNESENGGSNMDIIILNKVVEENYGEYLRSMFVRECKKSRR